MLYCGGGCFCTYKYNIYVYQPSFRLVIITKHREMPSRRCCTSQNETEEVARTSFFFFVLLRIQIGPRVAWPGKRATVLKTRSRRSIKSRVIGCETICFKLMIIQHVLFCLFFSAFAPAHFCLLARGFFV